MKALAPGIKIMKVAGMFTGPNPLARLRRSRGERMGIICNLMSVACGDVSQSESLKKEAALITRLKLGVGEGWLINKNLHNKSIIVPAWSRNRLARVGQTNLILPQKLPHRAPPCVREEEPITVKGCLKKRYADAHFQLCLLQRNVEKASCGGVNRPMNQNLSDLANQLFNVKLWETQALEGSGSVMIHQRKVAVGTHLGK